MPFMHILVLLVKFKFFSTYIYILLRTVLFYRIFAFWDWIILSTYSMHCMYTRKNVRMNASWYNEQIAFHRSRSAGRVKTNVLKDGKCVSTGVPHSICILSGCAVVVRHSWEGLVHRHSGEGLEHWYVKAGGTPRSACVSRSRRRARGRARQTCTLRTSRVRANSARAVLLARTDRNLSGNRGLRTRSSTQLSNWKPARPSDKRNIRWVLHDSYGTISAF